MIHAVEGRRVFGPKRLPVGDGGVEGLALGGEGPVARGDVLDRGVVGPDQPGAAPASIDMLQTVIRPSIESAAIAGP